MTPDSLMESRLWIAAGWTMLHFLWVGGVLGLLAAAGRLALRSAGPNVRYTFALVCLVAFALAVPLLGVWLATPVLLVPALWVMGERRWWTLSLVPVLTAFVGWGLIEGLLDVYVPGGAFFVASG